MISRRVRVVIGVALAFGFAFSSALPSFAESIGSRVENREVTSKNFANSKVGIGPLRKMLVYLPAGYDASSSQRYPVIYFLPNPFEDSYRFDFDHRDAQVLFDRAIAESVIKKFILVAVDMNTPLGSSWYVNSSATGNWEDFMIQELVPYLDANFKTLPNRDSRGIAGPLATARVHPARAALGTRSGRHVQSIQDGAVQFPHP